MNTKPDVAGHEEAPGRSRGEIRAELDERLLVEARARAQGARLRRFLMLLAFAFVLGVWGLRGGDPTLGIAVAAALVVAAVVTLVV